MTLKTFLCALALGCAATTAVAQQHTLRQNLHNQFPPHNGGAWQQDRYHHRSLNGTGLPSPEARRGVPVINAPGSDVSRFRDGRFVDRDILNDPWHNDPIPLTAQGEWMDGIAHVVSNNRLTVNNAPVRLHGIDVLEEDQMCFTGSLAERCGLRAREALVQMIQGERVRCRIEGHSAQGETIATCLTPRINVNAEMVLSGHAMTWHGLWSPYEGHMQQAAGLQAGAWATDFVHPELFRTRHAEQAQRLADDLRNGRRTPEGQSPFLRGNPGRATPVFNGSRNAP